MSSRHRRLQSFRTSFTSIHPSGVLTDPSFSVFPAHLVVCIPLHATNTSTYLSEFMYHFYNYLTPGRPGFTERDSNLAVPRRLNDPLSFGLEHNRITLGLDGH